MEVIVNVFVINCEKMICKKKTFCFFTNFAPVKEDIRLKRSSGKR